MKKGSKSKQHKNSPSHIIVTRSLTEAHRICDLRRMTVHIHCACVHQRIKRSTTKIVRFSFLSTNNCCRDGRLFSTRRLRINASRCSSWKQGQNYQVNFWNGIHRGPEYKHDKSPENNHNYLFQTFLLCCSSKINIGHQIRNFRWHVFTWIQTQFKFLV